MPGSRYSAREIASHGSTPTKCQYRHYSGRALYCARLGVRRPVNSACFAVYKQNSLTHRQHTAAVGLPALGCCWLGCSREFRPNDIGRGWCCFVNSMLPRTRASGVCAGKFAVEYQRQRFLSHSRFLVCCFDSSCMSLSSSVQR